MLSGRISPRLLLGLSLLLCTGALHLSSSLAQHDDSSDDKSKGTSALGRRTFNSTCAGCHGLDGRGSEKAVNIAGNVKVQRLSDDRLSSIISEGIPGTGMPAFRALSERQTRAVVSYLRVLQGKIEARILPGDATRGKDLFFGKGECSTCHTIFGKGGFLGPDLSGYGSALSAEAIRDGIVKPDRIESAGYRSAVLTTQDGIRLEGVVRNEDNFSVQLLAKDGTFHFFQKSDLRALEYIGQSLMPRNYPERLSPAELNDLVSFLMKGEPAADKARAPHKTEDPPE
jgi:cytochrome c oxidase cbb3-type subunit III